jgi:hypothetical protein
MAVFGSTALNVAEIFPRRPTLIVVSANFSYRIFPLRIA